MTERIRRLRERSLRAEPSVSGERARLITHFYASGQADNCSEPVRRASAFAHYLENKAIFIDEGELIVGERGEAPKATPTYPEITIHSLEDLRLLDSRKKIPFRVDPEVFALYEKEIIPFWKGKSMRERLFSHMSEEWVAVYEAGIFTEFMEQRAPGHTVLDDKIYRKGFEDFLADISRSQETIDWIDDPDAFYKNEELKAMAISAKALIRYAERHAEKAKAMGSKEKDPARKKEWERIVAICSRVPAKAPRDFWEALQYYWFVHLGVICEFNTWDSFNPGRLDQHLLPFYRQGIAEGTLTEAQAHELLHAFWIKFNNQPAPPKVGVTAEESGTYTDFALINVGGVDVHGRDAVNEISYMILDVIQEMRLLQPSSMIQVSTKTPDAFIRRAIEIIRTGFGQPSVFNTDAIVQEMLRQGKTIEDARSGGASGCVETGAFGKESYILTGYFNLPKILEITLNNGLDTRTGKKIGIETGAAESFGSYEAFVSAYAAQVDRFARIKMRGSNVIERLFAEHLPTPFLSLLIDDCIARGKDYHDGGARYNTSYIQGVGLGSITDSLSAIKHQVIEKGIVSLREMRDILQADFAGKEDLRQLLINKTPKYGNDDDTADEIAREVFEIFYRSVDSRKNTKGGAYRINMLPTTCHIYFGKVTGATPDGRRRSEPLSEGISPVQGMDRHGPTAVIQSAAKIDHIRTGGTLLNQKFTPAFFKDDSAIERIIHLIHSYFSMDGHHIQFNVVDGKTLMDAKRHPEKYRDLIVRVAGYSDYFVDLSVDLQNEIICRTEQPSI